MDHKPLRHDVVSHQSTTDSMKRSNSELDFQEFVRLPISPVAADNGAPTSKPEIRSPKARTFPEPVVLFGVDEDKTFEDVCAGDFSFALKYGVSFLIYNMIFRVLRSKVEPIITHHLAKILSDVSTQVKWQTLCGAWQLCRRKPLPRAWHVTCGDVWEIDTSPEFVSWSHDHNSNAAPKFSAIFIFGPTSIIWVSRISINFFNYLKKKLKLFWMITKRVKQKIWFLYLLWRFIYKNIISILRSKLVCLDIYNIKLYQMNNLNGMISTRFHVLTYGFMALLLGKMSK